MNGFVFLRKVIHSCLIWFWTVGVPYPMCWQLGNWQLAVATSRLKEGGFPRHASCSTTKSRALPELMLSVAWSYSSINIFSMGRNHTMMNNGCNKGKTFSVDCSSLHSLSSYFLDRAKHSGLYKGNMIIFNELDIQVLSIFIKCQCRKVFLFLFCTYKLLLWDGID